MKLISTKETAFENIFYAIPFPVLDINIILYHFKSGYYSIIKHLRNCKDNSNVMRISQNSTVNLNKDCNLISDVCTSVLRDYAKTSVRIIAKKENFVMFNSTLNLCEKPKTNPKLFKTFMAIFGFPQNCSLKTVLEILFFCEILHL